MERSGSQRLVEVKVQALCSKKKIMISFIKRDYLEMRQLPSMVENYSQEHGFGSTCK